MLGFGALNAVVTDNDSSFSVFHEVRKEEQEAEALALYNKAIDCHKNNKPKEAKEHFFEVLQTDLSTQAPEALSEGDELLQNAALFLKYNVFKQLADIFEAEDEKEKALDYLLEAAVIDESDVSLWWKVGQLATSTLNVRLARYAYEKGLIYSPNHWLCLDHLITVLYVIGDYQACLDMIAKAFERDGSYSKGFAIRDQIFKEEPHFKKSCISSLTYMEDPNGDENEYQNYIEEALILRGQRKLLAKCDELPKVKLTKPLQYYTWLNIVESLLQLYQELTAPKSQQSLCWSVDLEKYYKTDDQQATLVVPSPDILSKKYNKSSLKDSELKNLKRKKILQSSQDKDSEPQPKRRSTRVKLSKHKETDVNWSDLVYAYFPACFRTTVSMTDTEDSQDSQFDMKENQVSRTYWGSPEEIRKESILVSKFINKNIKNTGCMGLIENLMLALSDIWHERWSSGLSAFYQPLYERFRKHTCYPNIFSADNDEKYMERLGKIVLMSLEFQLDHLAAKTSFGTSPILSPYKGQSPAFEADIKLKFLSDLHYISVLGACNKFLADSMLFKIRFYWVQGRYCMIQNEMNMATNAFCNCTHLLSNYDFKEVVLYNCQFENTISEEYLEKKLDSAKQSQSLDELQMMLNQGKYQELISLLESALDDSHQKVNEIKISPERPLQFLLLQESYFLSKNYKKCFECTGAALTESLLSVSSTETWKLHFNKLLTTLNSCFTCQEAQDCLTDQLLQKYCDKLVKLIELSMDNEQNEHDLTTLPWLITYRIMKVKHGMATETVEKMDTSNIEDNITDNSEEELVTMENGSPLKFLKDSHEYLGRKHWCCHDNGLLLQEFVKEGLSQLNKVSKKESEDLHQQIEQCFYCLYGNPCKKSKTKIIQEHNDKPILLTWQNAKILFEFYKPAGLPELDLRTNTISVEVQNVLRKIVSVVPQHDIEAIPFETLQQYIDGGDTLDLSLFAPKERTGLDDLFYYLGDFYFKNKEFSKALKFYMHDVCVEPTRFQSWAAMALIRGTRLEEKINQCDLKSDGAIKKHITATLRCYEKAVTLHHGKCLVLEEYGQTAYMLHSYAARKFYEVTQEEKQDRSTLDYYKTMQRDMLLLSEKCFADALKIATSSKEGERWLHYYMLGKTAEKLEKAPGIYLDFYQKSLEELYQSGAHYSKKIPYHSAPEYSIEAVELFYRLHASVLKILNFSEKIDYDVIEEQLQKVIDQNIYQEAIEIDKSSLKEYDKTSDQQNSTIIHQCQQTTAVPIDSGMHSYESACMNQYPGSNLDDVDVVTLDEDMESVQSVVTLVMRNLLTNVSEILKGEQNTVCDKYKGIVKNINEDVRDCLEEIIERIHNENEINLDFRNSKYEANTPVAEDSGRVRDDFFDECTQRRSVPPCDGVSNPQLSSCNLKHDEAEETTVEVAVSSRGKYSIQTVEETQHQNVVSHDPTDIPSVQVSCEKITTVVHEITTVVHQQLEDEKGKLSDSAATSVTSKGVGFSDKLDGDVSRSAMTSVIAKSTVTEADETDEKVVRNVLTGIVEIVSSWISSQNFDGNKEIKDQSLTKNVIALNTVSRDDISLNPFKKDDITLKAVTKDDITLKAVTKDDITLKAVTKYDITLKAVTKDNITLKAVSKDDNTLKTVTKENNALKIFTKDDNESKAVSADNSLLKPVTKESSKNQSCNFDQVSKIQRKTLKKRAFKDETEERRYVTVSKKCLNALGFCIRRFPEHYKSQYMMAFFLANNHCCKNVQWSRDLLLGGSVPSKYSIHLPIRGIFSGKKKTNLFQYLWRIPVNEIDRAGSFCTHICRAVELLLNVLHELSDTAHLLHISTFLYKTPDKDKKYLRDNDRAFLAVKAFDFLLDILEQKVHSLSEEEELKALLLDLYEAYKHSQKMQISQKVVEYHFVKSYEKLLQAKPMDHDDHTILLDDVIKFCQRIKPST